MHSYRHSAFWAGTTHISAVLSMLVRNIIFARLLSPNDFSIALTFGVVLSFFEYLSNFGHELLMQRSSVGGHADFQATMQSAMIIRGLLVALFIVLISPYIPDLLKLHDKSFNYALLAVVPLINGFAHLDHQRLHRRQIYTVSAKIGLTADVFSVIVALVCVSIWDSYWAFYVSFVFRHSTSTVLSHLYARRSYALAFDLTHIRSLIQFGLPLILVGLLKYFGIEVDKVIVARIGGPETFTTYVLTLMLVVNGANLITVALSKIFIRRASTAGEHIVETVKSNGVVCCYLVLPILIVLCCLGDDLLMLIFGQQYTRIPWLIFAVCAVVGIRSINQWLNHTVIASAPTKLMLFADLVRVCTAAIAVWLVYSSSDVIKVAAAFWLAELMYFVALSIFLNRRFPIVAASISIFLIYAVCIASLQPVYAISYDSSLAFKIGLTSAALCLFYAVFLSLSASCRNQTQQFVRSFSARLKLS